MTDGKQCGPAPGVFFADSTGGDASEEGNYRIAEGRAWEQLDGIDWPAQLERCAARQSGDAVEIDFFNLVARVDLDARRITFSGSGVEMPIWERILVLHYLASTALLPPPGELIDFQQVPAGGFYFQAYRSRTRVPLAKVFGGEPGLLLAAGRTLGGEAAEFGDAGVRLWPLPRVPVVALVYTADEEFPASGNLLYESSITAYLCTEDIAVLGGQVVGRLVSRARGLGGEQ